MYVSVSSEINAAVYLKHMCLVLGVHATGLTSRPQPPKNAGEDVNPYALGWQADLTLQLAWALGLRRVVLVGHADGALLALITAAKAAQGHAFHFKVRAFAMCLCVSDPDAFELVLVTLLLLAQPLGDLLLVVLGS